MDITGISHVPEYDLLRLHTAADAEGWAPGVSVQTAEAITAHLGDFLIGGSPWERDRLWRLCREAGRAAHLAADTWGSVDVALWDLFAKAQGLPLFRAIGGFRDRVPAVRRGARDLSAAEHVSAAVAARDDGFWGYCICATAEADHAGAMPELRAAVGGDFRILYDAERRFALEQALAVGRVLEQIDAHWFAEPLSDREVTGLQKLSDALAVSVVAGAFMGDSMTAGTRALTSRAVDRVRATIPLTGGLTEALKLARGAEAVQMNCEIDWTRPSGPYAAAQLLGAVRNAEFYLADGDDDGAPGFKPLTVVEGEVHLTQEPGLGLQPTDPQLLTALS